MFRVRLALHDYRISFRYGYTLPGRAVGPRRVITCTISQLAESTATRWVGRGTAFCHPQDHFAKGVGRRIALTKALRDSHWPRAARSRVWQAYFLRHSDLTPQPKRQKREVTKCVG